MKKTLYVLFLLLTLPLCSQNSVHVVLNDSSSLRLSGLKIDVQITGNFATTTYDMQFYNERNRTLEGELRFPLGEGQAVSRFAMEVNRELREAVIVEKELARVAFESTVRQNIDPGLLEKTEGNNYKARIYPILPRAHKRVVVSYEQELASSDGVLVYELPLGIDELLDRFSIRMEVRGSNKTPIVSGSDYQQIRFNEKGEGYGFYMEKEKFRPQKPLIVQISNGKKENKALTYKDYFYLYQQLKPQKRLKEKPESITLLWDASYSMRYRNLEKELKVLDNYFGYLEEAEVSFIAFNNKIQTEKKVMVSRGDWSAVRQLIDETEYDGGTSFNLFNKKELNADEILLFSDGLANLGDFNKKIKTPVYTINSLSAANHGKLSNLAVASGGTYMNLSRMTSVKASELLKYEIFQFLGTRHGKEISEVYPKNVVNVTEDFSISGRFTNASTVTMLFGYGGKVTGEITIPVQAAESNKLVKRLWAKKKLEYLNRNKEASKDAIIALAKAYDLVTDYTSMIILDRIEDYVRYRIEPPMELRSEYKSRLALLDEEDAYRREALASRKNMLSENYDDLMTWYRTVFPKKKDREDKVTTSETQPRSDNNPDSGTESSTELPTNEGTPADQNNQTRRAAVERAIDTTKNIVSGIVSDADDDYPLPGANIMVKGKNYGTTADFDGNFSLNAEIGDVLVITYIGYTTREYTIRNASPVMIKIEADHNSLEEVVITGYAPSKEKEVTSEFSGVQTIENDRETFSPHRVSAPIHDTPLYVLDGLEVRNNPLAELSSDDIESIQTLKGINATAVFGARAANGVMIITTKKGKRKNQHQIEELHERIADKIELKSWNPDTPYISILNKEASPEAAYKKYLHIRDEYANSPSFYLDVSDFFDRRERSDLAVTILTNLMEVDLNNHELMKALAYKLEYYKKYDLAVVVYKKILELRPEEPQSYRDLALACEQAGDIQKSFDLLFKIYDGQLLEKDEEERFEGIEQIAYVELSRLAHKYDKQLKLKKSTKNLFKPVEVDVRVVIDWNHNDTDIDLWVIDPSGEKASYDNKLTVKGGRMSEDMTEGYGPEEFMLKTSEKGVYQVLVDYFADNVQKISGPTILKVSLFSHYGKPNEEKKTIIVRLDKEEEELEIGRLSF